MKGEPRKYGTIHGHRGYLLAVRRADRSVALHEQSSLALLYGVDPHEFLNDDAQYEFRFRQE